MSKREIITLQIGRAGNSIGNSVWETLCLEHGLDKSTGKHVSKESTDSGLSNASMFFCEDRGATHFPRAICCDSSLDDMMSVLRGSPVSQLYPSRSIIGGNVGSSNCYAKAFHNDGLPVAQQAMSVFRKEIEKCDNLQGVCFLHAMSGGAGSGLTGILVKGIYDLLDSGTKRILYSGSIFPSPSHNDIVLESYNTALILQDLIEYAHLVFPFDNEAVDIQTTEQGHFLSNARNKLIANCLTALTSSQRFPGLINANLRKIHENTVPFRNTHFLTSSYLPPNVIPAASIFEKTQYVLSQEHVTLTVDRSSIVSGIKNSHVGSINYPRYLACYLAYGGGSPIPASEVDRTIAYMQSDASSFDPFLPDWVPNCLSASISGRADNYSRKQTSVCCFSNNTSIYNVFEGIVDSFDKRIKTKSHVYLYEENGIHFEELMEARNLVQSVSDEYKGYANFEDKIVVTDKTNGKRSVNSKGVSSVEQEQIARELLSLSMEGG